MQIHCCAPAVSPPLRIYMYCMCLVVGFTKVRTATAFYGVLIKSLASLKGSTRIYFTFNVFYNFRTSHLPPHQACVYPRGNGTRTFLSLPTSLLSICVCFSLSLSLSHLPPLSHTFYLYVFVPVEAVKGFLQTKGLVEMIGRVSRLD